MLPVTTLSKSEVSKMILYLYREIISHIGSVKYSHLSFQHVHPNYQGLLLPRIGLEKTTAQSDFSSKHIYHILWLSIWKGNYNYSGTYVNGGRIRNISAVTKLWEVLWTSNQWLYLNITGSNIWQEGVRLCTRKPLILSTQNE